MRDTVTLSCRCSAASVPPTEDASSKDVITKVLPRLTLFGALPPSILPILLSVRALVDVPKSPDRKVLRLIHYLIQLACGDGSAGTIVPFSPLIGKKPGT